MEESIPPQAEKGRREAKSVAIEKLTEVTRRGKAELKVSLSDQEARDTRRSDEELDVQLVLEK